MPPLDWYSLHKAAWKDHELVVKELLQAGIDVNIKNSEGKRALDLAKTREVRPLSALAVYVCVSPNQQQLLPWHARWALRCSRP